MSGFRLNVINPSGHDRDQDFRGGAGHPDPLAHAPVNFHAYAACVGGSFFRSVDKAVADGAPALVLLRRDLRPGLNALVRLREQGIRCLACFKETGSHQIAPILSDAGGLRQLMEIAALADGFLAPTPELLPVYQSLVVDPRTVRFIPTPYPLDRDGWDFSVPIERRRGIFIGTREFDVPTRRHAAALLCARRVTRLTGARVTVVNTNRRGGRLSLEAMGFPEGKLNIHEGTSPYPEYLRRLAPHRIILQLDESAVPGQVAGDALLCGLPCVGGNGTVESIAFPETNTAQSSAHVIQTAARLIEDDAIYRGVIETSRDLARKYLSFDSVAEQIEDFLGFLGA